MPPVPSHFLGCFSVSSMLCPTYSNQHGFVWRQSMICGYSLHAWFACLVLTCPFLAIPCLDLLCMHSPCLKWHAGVAMQASAVCGGDKEGGQSGAPGNCAVGFRHSAVWFCIRAVAALLHTGRPLHVGSIAHASVCSQPYADPTNLRK